LPKSVLFCYYFSTFFPTLFRQIYSFSHTFYKQMFSSDQGAKRHSRITEQRPRGHKRLRAKEETIGGKGRRAGGMKDESSSDVITVIAFSLQDQQLVLKNLFHLSNVPPPSYKRC
jgi:hypothetical protein